MNEEVSQSINRDVVNAFGDKLIDKKNLGASYLILSIDFQDAEQVVGIQQTTYYINGVASEKELDAVSRCVKTIRCSNPGCYISYNILAGIPVPPGMQ